MARQSSPDKMLGEWFWTDRWMGSRGFLLPMEPRGLYREMLTQAWRRAERVGRPELPNDPETIQRATGCTGAEWKRCWPLVAPHWRVDGAYLVNDTQLEVYAKCFAEFKAASDRGRKGAHALAQARAQAGAQASAQAGAHAPPEHVLKGHPPDPDPDPASVLTEQERSRRTRTRAFNGTRLKVTEAQHALVLDESGLSDVVLRALYVTWDAEAVASHEPLDTLAYIKRRAAEAATARRLPAAVPEVDFYEECQRLHDGTCGGRLRHHNRMLIDIEKAKAVSA